MEGNVTKNFSWKEVLHSNTAISRGISNEPTPEHRENLEALFTNIIQPLREKWGAPLKINSTYRSPELNTAIGGSKTSAHVQGLACDIEPYDQSRTEEFGVFCVSEMQGGILDDIDQLIYEFPDKEGNPRWMHIGYRKGSLENKPRKSILLAVKEGGRTVYKNLTKEIAEKYNIDLEEAREEGVEDAAICTHCGK